MEMNKVAPGGTGATASDPFWLPPQSIISFSGGRTSGLMLRRHLDAHGGTLPPDRVVVFCNTGKEREETLVFVHECATRWGVPIVWLEYVATPSGKFRKKDGKELWRHTYRVVDFLTASRHGEPFENVIATRRFLPNPVMRFCTGEMKIKTPNRFVRFGLGWGEYTNAIGFRADEPDRVANMLHHHKTAPLDRQLLLFEDHEEEDEEESPGAWKKKVPGETPVCPLFAAGITREDVMEFWSRQEFDLQLKPYEGNCDGCFLKGVQKLLWTFWDRPELADWWAEQERKIAIAGTAKRSATFRSDRPPYRELKLLAQGVAPPGYIDFGVPPDDSPDGRGCALWDDCRCTD